MSSPITKCGQTYKVVSGDTCSGMWTKFGLTSAAFYSLNPGISCNTLQINQQVHPPAPGALHALSCPLLPVSGVCAPGHGQARAPPQLPGRDCAPAHPVRAPPSRAPLQVCSKAAALVRGTGPACAKSWIVQPRNTCWAIWTLNNMTQAQFLAKNPGIMCQKLHVGQSVCVA